MLANPDVDVWTHPITFFQRCPTCEKDVLEIIRLCIKNKVLIEDNVRPRHRSPQLIETCRRMGATIVKGSDAHGTEDLLVLKEGTIKNTSD
jgi:histidinol phosphatase-like PHP family hydrolase